MSLSDRIPGYRNKSQVPPNRSRRSKIVYDKCGLRSWMRYAASIPEIPAPMITTSLYSSAIANLLGGLRSSRRRAAEDHRLLDAVEAMVDGIEHIVVPDVPRPVRAGLRQGMQGALHVAGVDVPRRLFRHRLVAEMRVGVCVTVTV